MNYNIKVINANGKVIIDRKTDVDVTDLHMMLDFLNNMNKVRPDPPESILHIMKTVCEHRGLEISNIFIPTRRRYIKTTRQICHYFGYKYLKYGNTENISIGYLGQLMGGKDHATVIHSYRTIKGQIETDTEIKNQIEEIETILKDQT